MNETILTRSKTNPFRQVWSLLLPFSKSALGSAQPVGSNPPGSGNLEGAKKKILVVDDDPLVHRTLEITLRHHGYSVIKAVDGPSAIGAVRKERPDFILLDLTFPPDVVAVNWDGFVILSWLKRLDEAKNIPVLVISAGEEAKYRERALAAGAIAFLKKPLNHTELLTRIEQKLMPRTAARKSNPDVELVS